MIRKKTNRRVEILDIQEFSEDKDAELMEDHKSMTNNNNWTLLATHQHQIETCLV
ncbi:hypothetical protein Ahy_A05g023051 [Arachis hypogaea]|nr:hypothetical protein Ahy_A05g023051 [Arachis hypogaea]